MNHQATYKAQPSHDLWFRAGQQLISDKLGILGATIVLLFLFITIGVWLGLWGQNWSETSDFFNQSPSLRHWFGTNAIGQDIASRGIYATKVAFEVGLLVAVCASLLGTLVGAVAGFKNNTWLDSSLLWLMGVIDSIPFYLFVAAIAYAMKGFIFSMHMAMILVFWTETARVIRGEVIKLNQLEFIESAVAMGQSQIKILLKHIIPNVSHLLIIQSTLIFVAAIKSEVILSFLGLGVKDGISWGLMIAESTNDIQAGYFLNFFVASGLLFILVIGFNLFSDALQDALDPKLQK
ncbi:ABC transporter permease [Marinicella litoralis]|uniref:Peptide/nickel transport system permease protein n=1 Tax=Marinicella litoralis TaxID=644220 RepID=A0A4R6Y2I5_9GAMM|nr:ABC transporter permease [Marinicella litoralis]TDR23198.1 peptide/nickel transport system permease protein [Marinicella litoralis]